MATNFINNNGGSMKLTKTEIETLLNTLLPTIHDYETISINGEGYEKEIATERYQVLTHLYDRLTEEAK
jgi:hypothetical protein